MSAKTTATVILLIFVISAVIMVDNNIVSENGSSVFRIAYPAFYIIIIQVYCCLDYTV